MNSKPTPPRKLADHIAGQLQELISARGLRAGARLPAERMLAAELHVSRPSLREAIQKLASQGILESKRGGGTYVKAAPENWAEASIVAPLQSLLRSVPDYGYDVLEVRQALESATAWFAAQRATDTDRVRIRAAFEAMQAAHHGNDAQLLSRRDAEFHLAIAEASHNAVLMQVMRGLFELLHSSVSQSRQRMYSVPRNFEDLTAQHARVMDAILAGDADAARDSIRQHLDYVQTTLRKVDEDEARLQRSQLALSQQVIAPQTFPPAHASTARQGP